MIADQKCKVVSFLAARVISHSRFAPLVGHKARRELAHRAFRPPGREQTASDGFWATSARCRQRHAPPYGRPVSID